MGIETTSLPEGYLTMLDTFIEVRNINKSIELLSADDYKEITGEDYESSE